MSELTETNVLRWAAGADLSFLPSGRSSTVWRDTGIDADRLADSIGLHRLSNRFVERYQREKPDWCPPLFALRITAQKQQVVAMTRYQIETYREIARALAPRTSPLIAIKGFSTYVLTGKSHHIRFSGDLDVLYDDLDYLHEVLERLGYQGTLEKEGHESKMVRGDQMVEIHRYFPVMAYPPGLTDSDSNPAHHPGHWFQTHPDIVESRVAYSDIVDQCVAGHLLDTQGVWVPDVTMTVFLLCAHVFIHYIVLYPSSYDRGISIRLSEIAEIADLARLPNFDRERLARIVDAFQGQDCIRLAEHLVREYLCDSAFSLGSSSNRSFPRWISDWRCWVEYFAPEELLQQTDPLSVIATLGQNKVTASSSAAPIQYKIGDPAEGDELIRTIVHSPTSSLIPLQFSFSSRADALEFFLHFLRPARNGINMFQVAIHGGRYANNVTDGRQDFELDYYIDVREDGATFSEVADALRLPTLQSHTDGDNTYLTVHYPWEVLPECFREGSSLPLLLIVQERQLDRDGVRLTDPVMLIPIHLSTSRI